MRLTFLGTSSGTPTRTRNVSGLALNRRNRKEWFLVDCGEGTQHQILRTDYSLTKLGAIFITHVHGDHCYGLPGLLSSASMQGRSAPLRIVAPIPLHKFLRVPLEATQVNLSFHIELVPVENLQEPVAVEGFRVTRIPLSHRVPSYAYRFLETNIPHKLDVDKLERHGVPSGPSWGRLYAGEDVLLEDGRMLRAKDYVLEGRGPRVVVVAGDNDTPALLADACRGASVLVHEATFAENLMAEKGARTQHSSALRVARFAESVPGLSNLILTHFSARYQPDPRRTPSIEDIRAEARAAFSQTLCLAADLAEFRLDDEGTLTASSPAACS